MIIEQNNIGIEYIAATCMKTRVDVTERLSRLLPEKKAKRLVKGTGISKLSIAPDNICTSDFCIKAAEAVFSENLSKDEVGGIIFISQTADYLTPATAYYLQDRLNLHSNILAFDVNLGCSGFVYGLYLSSVIANNIKRKVLLCVGDTSSRNAYPDDTSMLPIAGDAGAVAVVGYQEGNTMTFNIESFGERADCLLVARGGARANRITDDNGNLKMDKENYCNMDGMTVMDFSLQEVPRNINTLIGNVGKDKIDIAYLHQGNEMIVKRISEQLCGIASVPFNAREIGNTSSASIPLCISELKRNNEYVPYEKVLMSGFGVGLSVASVVANMKNTVVLPTLEI